MLILHKIITNGFIPIIPVLIWNILFASRLPEAYGPGSFDLNIPRPILKAESIFRIIIFVLPLFMKIDISTKAGRADLVIYEAGSLLYYLSWLMLMYAPASAWSASAAGFTAPSYTPIIWFT